MGEMKVQERPVVKAVEKTLAFNVIRVADGLYAAQIIKYQGDRIIGIRTGNGTSFGHATCEAGDLLTHYHLYEFQSGPDAFFKEARMV